MLLLGMAVPAIGALIYGGRLMSEIEDNARALDRQQALLAEEDRRLDEIAVHLGAIAAVLEHERTTVRDR